ncbi:hypothetical protein COL22_23285 [Bacillus thuringiensis]|uniref:ArdC-like ssDNA-binding domain-containing protein n=1 Tax=Bacillus thuringiensis TaxID=1428 RepID=UPI000BF72C3C|nr:ArdC-like ssDNA-binding domain-containing protein [Bacillus thuringiensis]PFW05329.1 hypothetical protein COL22_23285 [Bacillus thuringiensis]
MSAKFKKATSDKSEEVSKLIDDMQVEFKKAFSTKEDYKELLKFMSRFHNYSFSNSLLIQRQFQGAQAVASFKDFKKAGFGVKKGEKGIKVLVPYQHKPAYFKDNKWIPLERASEKDQAKVKEGAFRTRKAFTTFGVGHVFDISQTNVKTNDLPKVFPNKWIEGNVANYEKFRDALDGIAKTYNIEMIDPPQELGVAKGAYYPSLHAVSLNPRNSELQNVKTLIHELAHARLHQNSSLSTPEKEFQAESVAYSVCSYFGLDTSEYSLAYLNHWTGGKDLENQKELIKDVRTTCIDFIQKIEEKVLEEVKEIKNESVKTVENLSIDEQSEIEDSSLVKNASLGLIIVGSLRETKSELDYNSPVFVKDSNVKFDLFDSHLKITNLDNAYLNKKMSETVILADSSFKFGEFKEYVNEKLGGTNNLQSFFESVKERVKIEEREIKAFTHLHPTELYEGKINLAKDNLNRLDIKKLIASGKVEIEGLTKNEAFEHLNNSIGKPEINSEKSIQVNLSNIVMKIHIIDETLQQQLANRLNKDIKVDLNEDLTKIEVGMVTQTLHERREALVNDKTEPLTFQKLNNIIAEREVIDTLIEKPLEQQKINTEQLNIISNALEQKMINEENPALYSKMEMIEEKFTNVEDRLNKDQKFHSLINGYKDQEMILKALEQYIVNNHPNVHCVERINSEQFVTKVEHLSETLLINNHSSIQETVSSLKTVCEEIQDDKQVERLRDYLEKEIENEKTEYIEIETTLTLER